MVCDSIVWNFLDFEMMKMGFQREMEEIDIRMFEVINSLCVGKQQPDKRIWDGLWFKTRRSLMRRAVEVGKFPGYNFNMGEDLFTHLQYADDTLIIGDKKIGRILQSLRQICYYLK